MIVDVLQIAAIVLAGLATVPAIAHVLELPGKMRLDEPEYRTVQKIYYPGFTMTGIAEGVAPLVVLVLLFLLPSGSRELMLTRVAFVGLVGVQAVYWLVTHPVNKVWVEGMKMGGAGTRFMAAGKETVTPTRDFRELRARWEYSHVVRAGLALASLIALAVAA